MHYSKEEKRKLLEKWRRSGMSAWSFAKEEGLCQQTFLKWKREETETASAGFVEVGMAAASGVDPYIIIKKGNLRIRVPVTLAEKDLEKVISAAGMAK